MHEAIWQIMTHSQLLKGLKYDPKYKAAEKEESEHAP
jgi:hypothetical protein